MKKIEYDYEKLIKRIYEVGLTKKKYAEEINLSRQELNNILKNISYFRQPQIDKSKTILKIADDEIFDYFFTQKVKKNFT